MYNNSYIKYTIIYNYVCGTLAAEDDSNFILKQFLGVSLND